MTPNDEHALTAEEYASFLTQVAAIRDLVRHDDPSITDSHRRIMALWDHLQVINRRNANFGTAYRRVENIATGAMATLTYVRNLHVETEGQCALCLADYPCITVRAIERFSESGEAPTTP